MHRKDNLSSRRQILKLLSGGAIAGLPGCGEERISDEDTTNTSSTPLTTTSLGATNTPTPKPTQSDEIPPQILDMDASYDSNSQGDIHVFLKGQDEGGLESARITNFEKELTYELYGKRQITVEGVIQDSRPQSRDDIQFQLTDSAGNISRQTIQACRSEPFAGDLRKQVNHLGIGLNEPEIVEKSRTFYLFYREPAGGDRIMLATSSDGQGWKKKGAIKGQGKEGEWDGYAVLSPSYIEYEGSHYIFFESSAGKTSPNYIGWAKSGDIEGPYKKYAEPVLHPEFDGGFEDVVVGTPAVAHDNRLGGIILYYHGWDGEHDRLAVARSSDLVNWERSHENPVVDVKEGSWYSSKIAPSDVIQRDGTDYIFVEGFDGQHWRSRLALSTDPFKGGMRLVDYNPILDIGGTGFDNDKAHTPAAIVTDNGVREILWVYYQGSNGGGFGYRLGKAVQPCPFE